MRFGASLTSRPRAALSRRSAAGLHGIRPDSRAKTDVTLPSPCARPRPTIDVHTGLTRRDVHTTREAFEHDRFRDQRLTLAGYTVVRFTWRQVANEPGSVAEALRSLLARLARP